MIESMTKPTQLKTLEQLKATLETTLKIETSTNNEGAKDILDLRKTIANADKLPELNENALKVATSEQTVSVASLKIEYFRLNMNELGAELQKVLVSEINNKQLRIDALKGLIKENTDALQLVGGNVNKASEAKAKDSFLNKILSNLRSKFVEGNK